MLQISYIKCNFFEESIWRVQIIQFNGLDWSLLVKHLDYEDIIKSCVYLHTNYSFVKSQIIQRY